MLGFIPTLGVIEIVVQELEDITGTDTCRIVPSSAVKKTLPPSALTSRLASVLAAQAPEGVNEPSKVPSGLSSTMVGGLAFPTNICPLLSRATAWILEEATALLPSKVVTTV